jgi:hypothetical protein
MKALNLKQEFPQHQSLPDAANFEPQHWCNILAELSVEVAEPLTHALERIETLVSTGRIDRLGLSALNKEVQQARRISIVGQQLTRLASGRLRQTPERLKLPEILQGVLDAQASTLEKQGIELKKNFKPVEVIADAGLLFNLLDSLMVWCLTLKPHRIELQIDVRSWPANARLICKFNHHLGASPTELPDTLAWRILQQTAWTMGLMVERILDSKSAHLALEFPKTVNNQIEGVSAIELDAGTSSAGNTKPLAGSQVLVIASRRDMRIQIRDAIKDVGLVVDFANSVDEAREFCQGGLPHVIVIESALCGERFEHFRDEISNSEAQVVFIEILEEGSRFEISDLNINSMNMAKVGREAIASSLQSALVFELSK